MGAIVRGRRSRGQWQLLIGRWERSGQGQQRFCEREGVAVSTFQYWRRRLREEASRSSSAGEETASLVAVEVRAQPSLSERSGLRLVTPSGIGIEVEHGFDAATLRAVLAVLGSPAVGP